LNDILPRLKDLKYIIYNGKATEELVGQLAKNERIVNVTAYDDLVHLGKERPFEPLPPRPNDIACIMYTSGSTGTPKGVILSHQNVIAAVAGVDNAIASDSSGRLKVDQNDRFLCFLPLAHILEFVYELCVVHWGGTIGYGNPRTVTDDSVRNCRGDIQEFKPTVLVAYVFDYSLT
jgi:long-chain acyl-CoA synthetase